MKAHRFFNQLSQKISYFSGHPASFTFALSIVLIWASTGPLFGFNDTWQLVINTGTTIITFLMVFLIQSTQNRDTAAMQLKLDELIRATKGTHNILLDLEELDENALEEIRKQYEQIAAHSRSGLRRSQDDTNVESVDLSSLKEKKQP